MNEPLSERVGHPSGGVGSDDPMQVLVVDNATADRTASRLERHGDDIDAAAADSARAALDELDGDAFDCVVSGYDLPERTGLDLLESVRTEVPDLPFVLFTDAGDEAVASDAIAAGVTDYVPEDVVDDPGATLAERVESAVAAYRAERAFARNHRHLEAQAAAMEASIDGIAILGPDGTYQYVNDAHVEVYGYDDADSFLGNSWKLCYSDEELERFEDDIMPELSETGGWRGEAVGTRKDGSTFPQALSLSRTSDGGIVCVVRDVTERKEHERRIEEQHRRLRAILSTTSAAIFVKDADSEYLLANEAFADLVGLDDPEDVVGLTDFELFPEDTAQKYRADDRHVLETGESVETEERVPASDGPHTHLTLKNPVHDEDGDVYAVAGVSTDITERKQRERELERERNRLDEFADIVSHDLRNPLNVASGALALVAEDCDSNHLETVERAHDRMEALVNDLLALARQGQVVEEFEPVDLDTVTRAAWRHVTTDDADLDPAADTTVLADRSRLQQLVENLLGNSVEHGSADDEDSVTVTVGTLDQQNGFYVADDGPGIPENERDTVFDRGYTTSDDGTGFGLAIVSEIADAHGWNVTVTESRWGGARFEITGVALD